MLKRYMHKRERHLAMLNDNRQVRPFEWGTEFIGHERDAENAHDLFLDFSRKAIEGSDEYFSFPSINDFVLERTRQESPDLGLRNADLGLDLSDKQNPQSAIRNPKSFLRANGHHRCDE